MAFTVHGYVNGVAYGLVFDPDAEPDEEQGRIAACAPLTALGILASHIGDPVRLTPTGPTAKLDLNDPRTVLAALRQYTEVVRVDGPVPDLGGGPSNVSRVY